MSYVAWVSELIMNYGIAKEALLEGSGLESLDFSDPEGRVSDAQHICLLRNAMQLCAARAVHVEGYAGILTAMSNLTTFLQRQFIEQCPDQWTCVAEREVLSKELSDLLSFRSRADVLLARKDGTLTPPSRLPDQPTG